MPFSTPSTATGITWADLKGSLLAIAVHSKETGIQTVHGPSNAIRADVTVLDGPKRGESYEDTLIFPKVLQSNLGPRVGELVLGRLGQGHAKKGQSAPWTLEDPTPADFTVGEAWLDEKGGDETPF